MGESSTDSFDKTGLGPLQLLNISVGIGGIQTIA